jgi:hypothetical protein
MRVYLVATILCLAAAVCTATEPEKRSDSELSHALIGSWEGKLRRKDYPVTKAFVSFNSNGALKWVEIMEFLGYYGRRGYEGKWHVTNGILISQITGAFGISYVDRDRIASVQDSVLILRIGRRRRERVPQSPDAYAISALAAAARDGETRNREAHTRLPDRRAAESSGRNGLV